MTYTLVWYIIGIVSSSPIDFHSEKIGLIRVTYYHPVSIRVNKYFKWFILKWATSLESSAQALLISTQKIGSVLCLSLSLSLSFFCFRSDCIDLDFKEISYLVNINAFNMQVSSLLFKNKMTNKNFTNSENFWILRSGLILTQHYVHPTCTPSRAALMTGRYSVNTGNILSIQETPTINLI